MILTQMDGSEVVNVQRIDTIINPNPRDVTGENMLGKQMVERLSGEIRDEVLERLEERQQALERLLGD